MSDSLRPLELQHSRLPCPSPSPGPCSNSCPLSQWCQPAILFSVVLSFSCLHSFPGPFLRDFSNESALHIMWPKYCSFSFSISPSNEYSGLISFRIWLIGSPCRPRDSQKSSPKKKSSPAPQFKSINSSALSLVYGTILTSIMPTGKTIALTIQIFVSKVMSLLFNMLSRLVIAFLPRSQCLLISWLQSSSAVILEPKKIQSVTVSIVSHLFAMKWWDRMPWCSLFECWVVLGYQLVSNGSVGKQFTSCQCRRHRRCGFNP